MAACAAHTRHTHPPALSRLLPFGQYAALRRYGGLRRAYAPLFWGCLVFISKKNVAFLCVYWVVVLVFAAFLMGCNQSTGAQKKGGVVALSPALTEFVLELAPEKLVATSFYTADARAASVLHLNQDGNLEKILSLRPDLVLGQPYDALLLEKLEKNHIQTSVHSLDSLSDIEQTAALIAESLGERDKAARWLKNFRAKLDDNRAKFAKNDEPLRALLIVDKLDARMMQFYIAARSTFVAELAQGCGLDIIDDNGAPWARIDAEALRRLNPDAIIYFAYQQSDADQFNALFSQRYPQLDAVKNQKIMVYHSPDIVIPGPGAAERQTEFCRQIDDFFRQSR